MPDRMSLSAALQALKSIRGDDEIVVSVMGPAREWLKLGVHPLDFFLVPSSMGQGTSLGLGLALAQPKRNVIVCNGDGSMLMNLGSLVTITAQAPPNLTILVFDNRTYEVTGAQPTPASGDVRKDHRDLDFARVARSCGFDWVFEFDELETWQREARAVVDAPGPSFAWIKVAVDAEAGPPGFPGPGKDRAATFRETLQNR